MRNNWLYALVAVVMAVLAWYYVSGRETVETWVEAPVEFIGMPQDLAIRGGGQSKIAVRLRGSKVLVRELNPKNLVYSINLSGLKPGINVLSFKPEGLPVSKGIEVAEINPQRINLEVDRLVEKRVPVKPGWSGTVDEDYQFSSIVADPATVLLRGPEPLLTPIDSLGTQPLVVNGTGSKDVEEDVPVVLDNQVQATPSHVTVHLSFVPKTKDLTFHIPVQIDVPERYSCEVNPSKVKVKAEVPLPLVRETGDGLAGYFSALAEVPDEVFGEHVYDGQAPVEVIAPKSVVIKQLSPEQVKVHITPPPPTNGTQSIIEPKEIP